MWLTDIWEKKPISREFLRFCLVGLAATGIHYGVYLLLFRRMNTSLAYSIAYVVSLCCNLLLTASFTFKTDVTVKRTAGFVVSHGVNYLLHIAFLNVFLALGMAEKWAPIPVFCIVFPINFILVRTVFKKL